MKKAQVISLLMCLLTVLPLLFVSCSNSVETFETAKTADNGDTPANTEGTVSETELKPDLPEVDMNGKEIRILTAGWGSDEVVVNDIISDEITGEPLNDAVFNRKSTVEQIYNCKIIQYDISISGDAALRLQNSVMADDNDYDIAVMMGTNFASLIVGGYLHDFIELPYIDITQPWWDKSSYDALAICGKHYGITGDITTRKMDCVWTMCFNKNMIENYSLDSPYELVKSGDWTIDTVVQMAKAVAQDINGDGEMTQDDLWGINYTGDTTMGIMKGCGVTIAENDANGIPRLTVDSESNIVKIQKIWEDLFNKEYSIDTLFTYWLPDTEIFAAGRCLFLFTGTHQLDQLRTTEVDFGIVPYPKYDKAQPDYLPNTAGIFLSIVCVPLTNWDLDNTGIFLERFAYEGRQTIVPAFYDIILKTKVSRDEESAEMLDYIYTNITYDTGNLYNFGELAGVFGYYMTTTPNANIVSTIERNRSAWESAINKLVEEVEKS